MPVGRDVDDTGRRRSRGPAADPAAVDAHLTRGCLESGEGADERGLSIPLDARETDDLAGADGEGDVVEVVAPQSADRQPVGILDRAGDAALLGEHRLELAPDGAFDDLRLVDLGGGEGPAHLAVAEHRDAVGDLLHLGDPVRDVDHRRAARDDLAHAGEQLLHLFDTEVLGRLVEDQDARVEGERFRDLHDEALLDRQVGDTRAGVDAHVPRGEPFRGPRGGAAEAADAAEADSDGHVLGDRQVRQESGVLADDTEAETPGLLGVGGGEFGAGDPHRARVRGERPGRDRHERGLPRPVLAHEGVDLAGAHVQVHVGEGADSREGLGDAVQAQQGGDSRTGLGGRERRPHVDVCHGESVLSVCITGRGSRRR
ncbi:hypothetical protein RKD05_001554 [Microbacterium sp. SLBN-111]